jgi:outer membrane receptor protein involved in Fe transport
MQKIYNVAAHLALLLCLMAGSQAAYAQRRMVHVCVDDQSGRAIAGVQLQPVGGAQKTVTGLSGCADLLLELGQTDVKVTHPGFEEMTQHVAQAADVMVVLHAAGRSEVVEVTAARVPLALDATASSVLSLTPEQLKEAPGLTLDDRLRQVAGFQLFRRTSSWVANPTTQGTSLRGLGSTAASRTLVLSDQVPLNDAFGGWIHWNEIPQLAVGGVELMRGGASDLYGSSAIGGVIDVIPVRPEGRSYAVDVSGASHGTSNLSGLLTERAGRWDALAATTLFRTDGYVLIAPEFRGPVDVPYNVHSQSGRLEFHRAIGTDDGLFVRGNILNEARDNGTRVQTNGTRLWRYIAGGDWSLPASSRLLLRLYGTDQGYRQSFSAIAPNRATERLTRLQRVPTQQLGGSLQWAGTYGSLTLVAGGDLLDTRGTDNETPVSNGVEQTTMTTTARQRAGGGYGEVLWQPKNWSVAFSSRVDRFRSFDAKQRAGASTTVLPSAFRAFRGPSMNELYRTGQVGQQITKANPSLRPERATGFEVGALLNRPRLGSVRTSYFWTQVNRPVAAVTLSSTPTSVLQQRENLGQLTSRGITVEAELRPLEYLTVTGGYQYADSTVTKFQANPALVGNWTAQVPRNSATAQFRLEKQRWGVFGVDLRTSGQQFDDTANQYRLAGYAQVDLYAEHRFGHGLTAYGSVQNVSGNPIEAGRTPVLTLGVPRTISLGLRLR